MIQRFRELMKHTSEYFRRDKETLNPSSLFKETPWYLKEALNTVKKLPENGTYNHSALLKLPENARISMSAEFDFENHVAKRVRQTIGTEINGIEQKESRVFLNIDGAWVSELSVRDTLKEHDKKPMAAAPRPDVVTSRVKEISDILLHTSQSAEETKKLVIEVATEPGGVLNATDKTPSQQTAAQRVASEMLKSGDLSSQALLKMTDAIDRSRTGLVPTDYGEIKERNFVQIVNLLSVPPKAEPSKEEKEKKESPSTESPKTESTPTPPSAPTPNNSPQSTSQSEPTPSAQPPSAAASPQPTTPSTDLIDEP